MSLSTILEAIKVSLATALPELKSARVVGGLFSLADKQREAVPLPAAFVSCQGTDGARVVGEDVVTTAHFAVVVVATDAHAANVAPMHRTNAIADLGGRTVRAVALGSDWGDGEVTSAPTDVTSRNKYTPEANGKSLAMWAVTWSQNVQLKPSAPAELDDLALVHAEWTLADGTEPDVPDAVDDVTL